MVLFEDVEVDLEYCVRSPDKGWRIPDLEKVLMKLEEEFLERMAPKIGLESMPPILQIRFFKLLSTPLVGDHFIYLPFMHGQEEKNSNHLRKVGFYCLHEAGHHLHTFAKPQIKLYRGSYQKQADLLYLFESVAELSALIFYNLTDRELPKDLNESYHPVCDALNIFLQEKGIDYSIKTLFNLAHLDPGKVNSDLYYIKKETRRLIGNLASVSKK